MPVSRRILQPLILGISLAALSVALDSSSSSALDDVETSAGTMKRSSGERMENVQGTTSGSRTSRSSSRSGRTRSGPRLPSDDEYDYDKKKSDDDWANGSSSSRHDRGDEDEFEPDSAPTLGQACIYGPNDEVVYRPKDSWCRGDAPLPVPQRADKAEATSKGSARLAPRKRAPAAAASSAYRHPQPRKKKVKRKTSAGCLYGKNGEVLYEPETSDCVNGIGAPPRP